MENVLVFFLCFENRDGARAIAAPFFKAVIREKSEIERVGDSSELPASATSVANCL